MKGGIKTGWMLIFCLAGMVRVQALPPALSDFAWRQEVANNLQTTQLYRVRLPGEVFDGCRSFPDDLRVFTPDGVPVPHWIRRPAPRRKQTARPADTLNRMWVQDGPYRRIDLSLHRKDPRAGPRHNLIRAKTSGSDFLRRVEVYGREPNTSWGLLGRGWLFRETGRATHRNERIEYPDSTLPELQIRIYADARNAYERFVIRSAGVFFRETLGGEEETVEVTELPAKSTVEDEGVQTLIFDTGHDNRPVDRLSLDSDTPEYVRRITVEGRNGEEWFDLGAGVVQRIDGKSHNSIDLNGRPVRTLRVKIFNHDDPPLPNPAVTVRAVPSDLVFETPARGTVALYYGNEWVRPPRYDLRERSRNRVHEAVTVSLGRPVPNEAFKARGFGKKGPWLAALAVAVVSALVLWAIVDMLRRHPAAPPNPPDRFHP